ncbi:MAG: LLM class flavin-dependent oxidoreductase [Gordonia sp. (in: high G+C Gram-positive bacteria)]
MSVPPAATSVGAAVPAGAAHIAAGARTPMAELVAAAVAAERAGAPAVVLDAQDSETADPFLVTAAVAVTTESIILIVKVPVAQWHPYLVARRVAQLDKLSAGRLRWWPIDHDVRRRDEAVAIVAALLRSWPAAAIRNDRATGIHVDTDLIVPAVAAGRYFSIDSPLDTVAGPQGVVPVITDIPESP